MKKKKQNHESNEHRIAVSWSIYCNNDKTFVVLITSNLY